MKKALVLKQEWNGRSVGEILMIDYVEVINKQRLLHNGVCEALDIPEALENNLQNELSAVLIEEVVAVAYAAEYWTDNNGGQVWNVNDIPTLVDANDVAYLDPDWVHVEEVLEVVGVPAHYEIQDNVIKRRNNILAQLRGKRAPLLIEADVEINKIIDANGDHSAWSLYRQELRDIPSLYIKVNGDPKVSVDSLDVENFVFPTKPV